MASQQDIQLAFQRAGKGSPTQADYQLYGSNPFFTDAGKVEGDVRAGGGGATIPNPVDEIIKQSVAAYQKQLDDYTAKGAEYDAKNPFSFDDVLAAKTKEVGARLDPYYTQTLNDYLTGINTQRNRSIEDNRTVLSNLSQDTQHYLGTAKTLLGDAIDKSGQGFADANLFFSGARQRDQGQLQDQSQQGVEGVLKNAQRTADTVNTNDTRNAQDTSLEAAMKTRDINQQKYADTTTGALNETNIAQNTNQFNRNQYIGGPYATMSLNNLPNAFGGAV